MFKQGYKYFNKWFVVGTVTGIDDQTRTQGDYAGTSYGVQLTINTGSPGGLARVRILNNRNVPNAYDAAVNMFEIGSRVAVGFNAPQWLKLEERQSNGRTYRNLNQFHLPELATLEQHNRYAGKFVGELVDKKVEGDTLVITLEHYETDKDDNEVLYKGESQPRFFTLVARDKLAQELYNQPIGANLEVSVRMFAEAVRDDYGDIIASLNEVRIEKYIVHTVADATQTTPFGQTVQTPFATITTQQPVAPWAQQQEPAQANPFGQTQQQANPFGQSAQANVPFPGAGGGNTFTQQYGEDPFANN